LIEKYKRAFDFTLHLYTVPRAPSILSYIETKAAGIQGYMQDIIVFFQYISVSWLVPLPLPFPSRRRRHRAICNVGSNSVNSIYVE